MSYNHRPLSPGGHRLQNPARASDNTLTDHGYYQSRHNSYASPRTSTGVIPISTQTFINVPPPSSARSAQQYDSYSGRPRRSSLVDTARSSTSGPSSSSTILPSRSRPTVIQQDVGRPTSPTRAIPRDKDYYVTPASSHEPRVSTTTHKKVYSVDGDGSARLVADVNISATGAGEKHQRRKDSMERGGYSSRTSTVDRERGRRGYHTNASHNRPLDKSIEDEDAYSYTDPASMYRDTEPRWREVRPRRGSVDRGGATSRERPVSMIIDPSFGQRQEAKAMGGPPPSTRGWDKIQDNLGRTSSVRDASRTVAQSPTRGRTYPDYGDSSDVYYVAPRTNSTDRRATIHNYDSTYDYERDVREPRRERKQSVSRNDGHRADQSVERRGFGINPNLRSDSQTRYSRSDQAAYGRGDGRGSDESFERADRSQYRDSGYVEQHRRAPAAETQHNYHHHQHHDSARMEQEKRDREYTQRLQSEERDRLRERELREGPVPPPKRRDDYERDHERPRDREYDRDRERERERARQMEPPSERDKDRHHQRRDTDRDRDYNRKDAKGDSPRQSGETTSKPGISQVATGGLAGAAAAFGLTGLLNKVTEKREKDRGESKDREATRDRERERERERERDRERRERREDDRERRDDRDRKDARAASDEQQHERDRERDRAYKDSDRGLGFAFEGQPPEPPKSAPPHNPEWQQDRSFDRHDKGSYSTADSSFEKPREGPSEHPQDRPLDRSQDNVQGPPDRPASRQGYGPSERTAQRDSDTEGKPLPPSTTATTPGPAIDAEEEYRRRREQVQRELGIMPPTEDPRATESDPDRERRRAERVKRLQGRDSRNSGSSAPYPNFSSSTNTVLPLTGTQRSSPREDKSSVAGTAVTSSTMPELHRKPSILDRPMISDEPVQIIDNSLSDRRENRVRIVDPPTEPEDRKPKGILKKPTEKFPEDSHAIREGVAPLKDATKKGIPPGARWTKIDRRLVNPEALEASHERFEERLDCVIVLRVLTKDEIQKLADKTRDIRDKRYEEERSERSDRSDRKSERRSHRNRDRRDRDEYEHSDSEDEYKEKKPKMLEAPTTAGASNDADFIRDNQRRHDRDRDAESGYVSGGPGVRDDRRHEESRSRY